MGRLTVPYRKTRLDAGGYQVEFVTYLTASLVIKSKKTSQPAEVMRYVYKNTTTHCPPAQR